MTENDDLMALCAIRYTMGRQSYIVAEGVKWAIEWGAKSNQVRSVLIRDLEEAVYKCDNGFPALGDPRIDELQWRCVLDELKRIENTISC